MATNDFVAFAIGAGANVLSQSAYLANSQLAAGQQPGVASSALNNKALRQATFVASALAQVASSFLVTDVLDDGVLDDFIDKIITTFPLRVHPAVTRFTTVGSDTYTTPTNSFGQLPTYLRVRMAGGGSGGAGSGTGSQGSGGGGGSTTFGVGLLTAGGGFITSGGNTYGGAGGNYSVNFPATTVVAATGTAGGSAFTTSSTAIAGGNGGSNTFGGGGPGGPGGNIGLPGGANTGAGGGGGGNGVVGTQVSGAGGGSGAYIEVNISGPAASYPITVGAGGAGGTAGTSGFAGGNGGSGIIIVEAFF